ncbi:arabinofuranosidase catalytic domain-containing protein [Mycolicibacterium austroafricanum]|uniref:arabinofuranosidase catalytic domain-containing protein n=1 Tax=Mycolicibacterium austroafricanum TaxID=39687 RepID=UPI001CA35870|nr:arabinofuranosidase catalytic domain-containing protein [Mycolicibacterium austroafricanum]QZT61227.1 hypothetical protein JN085_19870 [Mycolicibacterium austroafricanum]
MVNALWFTYAGEFSGDGADLPYDKLLIDNFASVYQAYSLRQLSVFHTGPAVRVRRSSDNAVLDVGFVDGLLDTASLTAFVGANSAYVHTWYDQSGNARNMVQATTAKQPRIVNAGTLVTIGDAPGVEFTGTDVHLKHTAPGLKALVAASGATVCEVHTDASALLSYGETDNGGSAGGRILPFGWSSATPPLLLFQVADSTGTNQAGYPSFAINAVGEVHSDVAVKNNGAGAALYRDGIQKVSNAFNPTMPTSTMTSATLGGWEAATAGSINSDYVGKIGEHIIIAGAADTSDVAVVAGSHATYFGI